MIIKKEIKHAHFFAGLGGGAKGFNRGQAKVGNVEAVFRCIGGIDVDPEGIKDFEQLAGVKGTLLDLFDREQYISFHGKEPPRDWRAASPEDIRKAFNYEVPNIVFLSPPCKGFSGLLSEDKSKTDKYQALNRLTIRGVFLMLEAWQNDLPELIILENVPRIATRGRKLLDQINELLRAYGYAVSETTHDCGEIGGLAQSRKRFLLVARNIEKVPPYLYEPEKKSLLGVGQILEKLPIPGTGLGGPMHRIPELQWKTWVRLAFVQAGSDWRSLNRLKVENGYLKDYLILPGYHNGYLGVNEWNNPMGTVAGRSTVTNGAFAIGDPRIKGLRHNNVFRVVKFADHSPSITGGGGPTAGGLAVADPRAPKGALQYQNYGVRNWEETSGAIIGVKSPGQGTFSVADPRPGWENRRSGNLPVTKWENPSNVIACATKGPGGGAGSVADPRINSNDNTHTNKFSVGEWDKATSTVIGTNRGPGSGAGCIADPRPGWGIERKNFNQGGHYGVVAWDESVGTISANGKFDNSKLSVGDPRILPDQNEQLVAKIISEDGTWHRPFTTLELAALQGLIDPEEDILLCGNSDSGWRERIGNAVPPAAAEAIASEMGRTLLLAWSGQTFHLANTPIWVRPLAVALAVNN